MSQEEKQIFVGDSLKSKEEYLIELKEICSELEVGLATDTLIADDLKMLTRIDEITIILMYMEAHNLS